ASYQADAALSRVPLYVGMAVAWAFFPSLARRATGGVIAARAVQMYAAATLLKYTAVTGLAVGGISLITAFFQAADDYSCLWWLSAGLAGYTGALLVGW